MKNAVKTILEVVLATFLVLITVFTLFRNFFKEGFLDYPDFYLLFLAHSSITNITAYVSAWNFGFMGGPNSTTISIYLILNLFASLGLYGVSMEMFLDFSLLAIGFISLVYLIRIFSSNVWVAALSALIYILTPMLFLTIFNGDGNYPFYAMLPAFILLSYLISKKRSWTSCLMMSGLLGLGEVINPYTVILVLPVMLVALLLVIISKENKKIILKTLLFLFIPIVFAILINFPYFIGIVTQYSSIASSVSVAKNTGTAIIASTYQWAGPFRAWTLLGSDLFPRYSMFYGELSYVLLFILPVISLGSLFVHSENLERNSVRKYMILLLWTSYILLEAGHYGLLSPLFSHFPILDVFNYPSVFSFFLNASYAVLIPITLDALNDRTKIIGIRNVKSPPNRQSQVASTP